MTGQDAHLSSTACDLTIVGAGPAGLFAAYYAGFRGLSVTVVDSQPEPGGQVAALYPAKKIYDVAGFHGVTGAALIEGLLMQARQYSARFMLSTHVVTVAPDVTGQGFTVELSNGSTITSGAVLLATGVGGIQPRNLPIGTSWNGRGVTYVVTDPMSYAGQHIVIVGGGDSALDWALDLQPIARSVTVVHRRRAFRAHASSLSAARAAGIELLTEAELAAIHGTDVVTSVVVTDATGVDREIPADVVIGALGLVTAPSPFASWGLETQDRKIVVDSSMRTSVDGIFAAGDVSTYPGKVALMATGFGEAATAVNNAAVRINPELSLFPGHSTDDDLAVRASAVPD